MTETSAQPQNPSVDPTGGQSDDLPDTIGRLAELIGGDPLAGIDSDMAAVLAMQAQLGARPLEQLTPIAARQQPRASDAIAALLAQQERPPATADDIATEDLMVSGGEGDIAARLYRATDLIDRLNPMVLYFHGGGFITGDLDSHDASARALARRSGAIVLSVDYRLAPEHGLPAAHEDAWAAWTWLGRQAHKLGGDPRRVAVVGEDAGANLAMHVALRARDERGLQPVHQVLIHPMVGTDLSTASYGETLRARPIGLPAMRWRLRQLFPQGVPEQGSLLQLAERGDLAGLPSTTVVLARIDPLRSEGEALAAALEQAKVLVADWTYDGVTQGFFGLGLIVTKALFAQADVGGALLAAFAARTRH
ncbi:MAG: alpha/beta hydrolase [Devosia sp.]